MIFAGSQVLMDIEPLVGIIAGKPILHGPSHTILGALVIGAVSGAVGRPATRIVLGWLRIEHGALTWAVAFSSAYIGTYSHIALDAVMHHDMRPFWPFTSGNPILGLVSVGWLYGLCLASGLLGVLILFGRARLAGTKSSR